MKTTLKAIALLLAVSATAQSVMSYANDMDNLQGLVQEQEVILFDLLAKSKNSLVYGDNIVVDEEEKRKLIIENVVNYIRLIEGQEDLLEELKRHDFPELDIDQILTGAKSPTI
jgi:hypothetical protein